MDAAKCQALKDALAQQGEPPYIEAKVFFDGNDDPGSIGCNLDEHPGVGEFARVLGELSGRPDVQGVWVVVFEIDPGEDSWPFADLVIVAGTISLKTLRSLVKGLQPTTVESAAEFSVPEDLASQHDRLLALWWD
jgi:hypothetical protein